MKAITLTQPWASLVAIGAKRVETRSWRTPYRGPLAIHAAKDYPQWAKDTAWEEPFLSALKAYPGPPLPLGAVVATCRLVACIPTRELLAGLLIECDPVVQSIPFVMTEQERAFGDYEPGRWGWILADIKMLPEPVPARGALSLWEWNP